MLSQKISSEIVAHTGNIIRSEVNRNADYDLETWIQSRIQLQPGERVLDVGCGSGKQMRAFSKLIGEQGSIVGADIFGEVPTLLAAAKQNLEGCDNVHLLDHDANMPFTFEDGAFDVIISAYSIYYLENMEEVLWELRRLLKNNGGRLFIVGPSWDNSSEFYQLHKDVTDSELTQRFLHHLYRMNDDVLPLSLKLFSKVQISPFVNRVYFRGEEGLENLKSYYRASMMLAEITQSPSEIECYVQELELRVRNAYFGSNEYAIYKRAIGITAVV